MKQLILSCLLLFTLNSSFSQDYALWQKQIGYLFADLPLDRNSDVWLENIQMNHYRFKDSNFCNCPKKRIEFVVKDLNEYNQNISGVENALLSLQTTKVLDQEGKMIIDTIMTIHSYIYLKAGITKKEFQSTFKQLTNQIRKALPFSTSFKMDKVTKGSSKLQYAFTDKRYDILYPLNITYWYDEKQNNYVISLHFNKYKNGSGDFWPR